MQNIFSVGFGSLAKISHLLIFQLCKYFPPKQWISTDCFIVCYTETSQSQELFSALSQCTLGAVGVDAVILLLKTHSFSQSTKLLHCLSLNFTSQLLTSIITYAHHRKHWPFRTSYLKGSWIQMESTISISEKKKGGGVFCLILIWSRAWDHKQFSSLVKIKCIFLRT